MTDYYTKVASDARYYLGTTVLNSITAPTGSLSLNSQKIINLATPTSNTDATTKLYVDTAISGVSAGASSPIGSIIIWATNTIPTGYLLCDGSSFNITTYAQLYTALGNVSTVPDCRGYFVRGYDSTRLVDKTVRNIRSTQDDLMKAHAHGIPENTSGTTSTDPGHVHPIKFKNTNSGDSGQASESSTGG